MKKAAYFIVIFVFVLSLTACGNSSEKTNVSTQASNSISQSDENVSASPEESKNEGADSILELTYKVPMKNIYIDAPNYQEIEQGYTELFIVHETKYVAITAPDVSEVNDARAAHDKAFEKFILNMQNYEGGVNSLNILKDNNVTVNGIDTYHFEGTLNYGRDTIHDGYAIGYSFIMDGIPCEIIGSVIDDSQSDALKNEIASIVEAMMKSVRSEQ